MTHKTLTYTFHYWGFFCPGGICPRGAFVQGTFVRWLMSGGGLLFGGFLSFNIHYFLGEKIKRKDKNEYFIIEDTCDILDINTCSIFSRDYHTVINCHTIFPSHTSHYLLPFDILHVNIVLVVGFRLSPLVLTITLHCHY